MAPDTDESDILDRNSTKIIQYIAETMIYYARSVDPTMLWAINENFRLQSWSTRDTEEKPGMLIDYTVTYPNTIFHYKTSDMVLHVDSYAA